MTPRVRPLACILLIVFGACVEAPPPSRVTRSLALPAQAPAARVPLVPLALDTQADFDALEDAWLPRRESEDLVVVLQAYAAAQPAPDPLLLQRIAVLQSDRIAASEDALRLTLEASTRLRDSVPDSPHTAWLNGWVLWQFLSRGGLGTLDGAGRDIAQSLVDQWKVLLARAPDYVGPRRFGAAEVTRVVVRVEAALAEGAAPRPAGVVPAPPRLASGAEIDALAQLARFESANANARKNLCATWLARAKQADPPLTDLRLTVACNIQIGAAIPALATIDALRQRDGGAFDACAALRHLRERAGKPAVDRALEEGGYSFAAACVGSAQ